MRSLGFACVSELPLPSGRRADLVALNERGEIWIVEIKSSLEDLRADQKWPEYRAHCDRLFFAFTADLPCEIFPAGTGLAHTIINNTEQDVRILVVGEASRMRSRIHYPMHPKRNEEIGDRHWKIDPPRPLGPHDGLPDRLRGKA